MAVSAAERRRGRRDNGLDATDWRAIDDLDPRIAETVLDALATQGIAAYVQPAVDVDPVTRSATLPSRPSDRLYVDRSQVEAARECLRALRGDERADQPRGGLATDDGEATATEPTPDPDPAHDGADVDVTFAGIVAGFDRPVDPTAASWPASENLPGAPAGAERSAVIEPVEPPRPTGPLDARDVTEPSLLDALDTFGTSLPDQEPPERFIPPTPPPLPRLSRQTVLGWVAIVVGLLMLIGRPSVLQLDRNTIMLLGFASILGGAIALILRLRPDTESDEGHPNDGAQV